jgi:hypothetical protein
MNRRSVDPHSKYRPTISQKLDCCTLKMIDLIPENRYQSVWDLISEIENLPDNYWDDNKMKNIIKLLG